MCDNKLFLISRSNMWTDLVCVCVGESSMLWMVASLVKGVHVGISWVTSEARLKVWITDPIKTGRC